MYYSKKASTQIGLELNDNLKDVKTRNKPAYKTLQLEGLMANSGQVIQVLGGSGG